MTRIDFAVGVSIRAVRISSRAVRVYPALSLRRVRPSYGTFCPMVLSYFIVFISVQEILLNKACLPDGKRWCIKSSSCVFLFDPNQYVFSLNLFIVAIACLILGMEIECWKEVEESEKKWCHVSKIKQLLFMCNVWRTMYNVWSLKPSDMYPLTYTLTVIQGCLFVTYPEFLLT